MKNGLRNICLSMAISIAIANAGNAQDARQPAGRDWPSFGGDHGNTRYSTLAQIDRTNVSKLGGAWRFPFPNEATRAGVVVHAGVMYVTAGEHAYAIHAGTGELLWKQKMPTAPSGLFKGVALGGGFVYVGLSDGRLVALDMKNGQQQWITHIGDDPPLKGQSISSAPVYVNGTVVTGLANGDFGIRGRVVANDARTGRQLWRFDTVPAPGEPGSETWEKNDAWKRGGGGVWGPPVPDAELGIVYIGTGNPVPQWGGEIRGGDNLYTNSAVALDLKTGKVRWHFQTVHHDIWDNGLGTPFLLYDATVNGQQRKAIGIMRTDGYLFMLDRRTGKPLYRIEERPVPQNEKLKTAKTQPFPVDADQIGSPCVDPAMIPRGFKALCDYEPVDDTMPNAMYGILTTRAAPMAYSPHTRYFYATGSIMSHWIRRFADPYHFGVAEVPGQKSGGIFAALDSRTNRIVWQKDMPYKIGAGSGVMATAGDLLFHGEPDGNLQAYDAVNGNLLWTFQTGNEAAGPIGSYEVGGQQFVALTTTDAVWAFKLGGQLAQATAPPPPETVVQYSGRLTRTQTIQLSATVRDFGLEKTREAHDEFAFSPLRARVKAGEPVTFKNVGKEAHEAIADDGSWTTGLVAPGASAQLAFAKAGTFTYHCKVHEWSYGQIVVE